MIKKDIMESIMDYFCIKLNTKFIVHDTIHNIDIGNYQFIIIDNIISFVHEDSYETLPQDSFVLYNMLIGKYIIEIE